MLVQRDVIRFPGEPPRTWRVVWADHASVVLFDLDSKRTTFATWPRRNLEEMMGPDEVEIVDAHSYDAFFLQSALTAAQKLRSAEMMSLIAPLVSRAPEIFDAKIRGKAVADLDRAGVKSSKTLHVALDRYWRRGMSADALIPDFRECGRSERRPDAKKVGRKQLPSAAQGVTITPDIKGMFEKAIKRHYARNSHNALTKAYGLMLAEEFVIEHKDIVDGKLVYKYQTRPEWVASGFPTMRQFRYWYNQRSDTLKIKRKRVGNAKYDKDMRATASNAVFLLRGPGSRFEIDSTPLDIAICSELDRSLPVGRPTFYQVTDVFSKLVCGIYVGFENASWLAAGLTMQNVVEDKVAFAKRFGVTIERHEWPCEGVLPARLLADRGEYKHDSAVKFNDWSKSTVELAAPYRGDMKGSVEQKFNLFHAELRTVLSAIVTKNHAERGSIDYRRDAILNLREVTAAIIEIVVLLNGRKLVDYPRSRDLIAARVFAVPREMWAWGVETGNCELKPQNVARTRISMLPSGKATVDQTGYRFKKLYYTGTDANAEIYQRARQGSTSAADVSYHTLNTTTIYLHERTAPNGYIELTLGADSLAYADISFEEAARLQEDDRLDTRLRAPAQAEAIARQAKAHGRAESAAKRERPGGRLSAAAVKGMKQNRKDERDLEREARHPPSRSTTVAVNIAAAAAARAEIAAEQRDILGDDSSDNLFQ